jgi:hypothetical protein
MKVLTRTSALVVGLVGAIIGFLVNMLYSMFHFLGRIAGITANQSHFFIGTGLAILAAIGAMVAAGTPEVGALLLAVAGIGFFFVMGWWAIIPAIFLFVAAMVAFLGRTRQTRAPAGT